MLNVSGLHAAYGESRILHGIDLSVAKGEVVTLLGRNGMGKTTTIKSIFGMVRPSAGKVTVDGRDLTGAAPHLVAGAGLGLVPEGRQVFAELSVLDNIRLGAFLQPDDRETRVEAQLQRFPRLRERLHQRAGLLSGGEQQMIAIARALMSAPRMLMLDEPSLGLAPLLVKEIFENVERINREMGTTILVVEQNAKVALEISNYAYIMESGKIVMEGPSKELKKNPDVKEFYMGITQGGGRKSFKEVKSYKRRKRWM